MLWVARTLLSAGLVLGISQVFAAVSPEEAKRLETDLTPTGAERAGNAAGTIPAWDGGLTAPPPGIGYEPGKHHPDPFAADKPLFTINAANMAQYDAQLTQGNKALLTTYPDTYSMNVYPTHRSCAFPPHVYQAIARNAVSAKMINDENSVTGATMASPFPIPQSAREVLWNFELMYRGFKTKAGAAATVSSKGGDFTIEAADEYYIWNWSDPAITTTEGMGNMVFFFNRINISPPQIAGTMFLGHYTLDQVADAKHTWLYKTGERKVKRVTGNAYDAPTNGANGVRTIDMGIHVFSGAGDRYTWEQQGKSEKIIPYNTYRLSSPDLEYKDIIGKGHLNAELIRYELHRVWEIEGTLKPGMSHSIAHRRKFYFDEDTWMLLSTALYGPGGEMARVQEGFAINYYEHPVCILAPDVIYDIAGGVFHITSMRNKEQELDLNANNDRDFFTTESVRRRGVR
ncbi:MAG: DUF1329 domain-containing protein [Alphaproteobacteria bacterium]|nr:DUF1329 domain-containing protein [Alphaproteobacteria bacterium]